MEKELNVKNYLYLTKSKSDFYKKTKKKLMKKNIWKIFTHNEVNSKDEYPRHILDYLLNLQLKNSSKSLESKITNDIGVLLDNTILLADITTLLNVPKEYDILCLNANIKKYDWESEYNNIYWTKTLINDSHNFVINKKSVNKLLNLLKSNESGTWDEFVNKINNNLNIYTIAGGLFSETSDEYIHFPIEKYNSKTTTDSEKEEILNENEIMYIKKLETVSNNNINKIKKLQFSNYDILPSVSLICPYTDKNKFFNTVYTFLKLDYPRDKLELVVIDTSKSDKYLKTLLPEDSRIKILNIGKKLESDSVVSMGYMLNLGVKYATHELICHLFDSRFYMWESFVDLVGTYLLSNSDLMTSCDIGVLDVNTNISKRICVPDIGNMLYKKSFWKVTPFNSSEKNFNRLIYKFIYNRKHCISFLPFVYWSFVIESKNENVLSENTNKNAKQLNLDLEKLVPKQLKHGFDEIKKEFIILK